MEDLESSIVVEDVQNAVRGFFQQGSEMELRVSLTRGLYRGTKKAYFLIEEARVLKLLKAVHIKVG